MLYLVWVSISFPMKFLWSCYPFWYQEACNSFLRALSSFFRSWCLTSCIVLWGNTDVWLRRNHHGQTTSAWLSRGDLNPVVWQTTESLDRDTLNLVCSCLSGTVARGAIKVFDSWSFGAYSMCKNLVWRVLEFYFSNSFSVLVTRARFGFYIRARGLVFLA